MPKLRLSIFSLLLTAKKSWSKKVKILCSLLVPVTANKRKTMSKRLKGQENPNNNCKQSRGKLFETKK